MDSFGDAFKVASIAFKSEKPSIKARAEIEDYSTGFRLADETPFSGPINFIFKGVRLPFRALLFGDEFLKQFRNEANCMCNLIERIEKHCMKIRCYRSMDEAGMV